jgi:hypothetical protein
MDILNRNSIILPSFLLKTVSIQALTLNPRYANTYYTRGNTHYAFAPGSLPIASADTPTHTRTGTARCAREWEP